jgi:hypothetical protein
MVLPKSCLLCQRARVEKQAMNLQFAAHTSAPAFARDDYPDTKRVILHAHAQYPSQQPSSLLAYKPDLIF